MNDAVPYLNPQKLCLFSVGFHMLFIVHTSVLSTLHTYVRAYTLKMYIHNMNLRACLGENFLKIFFKYCF
jgi:hypothetical protein